MSVGANVHEARGSGTRLEFKRFFEIALKSARETEYWLRILKDAGYLESVKVESLRSELDEIISMLVSAIKKLKLSQPLPTSGI